MKTAYSYIRFSTIEQQKGDSLRRQIELSSAYAEEHGLAIDTALNLRDLGVSAYDGSNATRGALGGFLKAIESGKVEVGSFLLVESLDRLSRENVNDALVQFQTIIGKGITIVTLADKKTYSTASINENPMDLILSILIMSRAHEESDTKSKRGRAAWTEKRKNAKDKILTARCPRWLKVNDSRTGFDLIPENVAIVREILDLTSSGMGQSQIVKIFNKRKQKPFGHGKGWHSSSIQKILTSPALYGDFHLGKYENGKKVLTGEVISNYFPALITNQQFYQLQGGRELRLGPGGRTKKGETVANLFSGILCCGYCGGSMTLIGSSGKRQKNEAGEEFRLGRKAIACDNGRRGLRCWAVQWGYLEFEDLFLQFCTAIDIAKLVNRLDESHQSAKLELAEMKGALKAEIAALLKAASNLSNAIAEMGLSTILKERLTKVESELAEKQAALEKLDAEIQVAESAKERDGIHAKGIKEAISKIRTLPQDDLLLFRLSLCEHIRGLIKQITVFPAGEITTEGGTTPLRTELQTMASRLQAEIDSFRIVKRKTKQPISPRSSDKTEPSTIDSANLKPLHGLTPEDLAKRLHRQEMMRRQIIGYISSSEKTEPVRTGTSVRSRYNAKNSDRYIAIHTKSNNVLYVQPKKGDATAVEYFVDKNASQIWRTDDTGHSVMMEVD